ncbi:hypothetical protein JOB18_036316 [Solea senegalensis]|uniref:Uncharacterized protein n=1 Tax=Solea senegalensis TaxID=28829 RepID=A0AAV6R375_SOLSE|nr:hypothetical protein JOB18_036316 [Solea senegalensis]
MQQYKAEGSNRTSHSATELRSGISVDLSAFIIQTEFLRSLFGETRNSSTESPSHGRRQHNNACLTLGRLSRCQAFCPVLCV